jgi:hypothetical protein
MQASSVNGDNHNECTTPIISADALSALELGGMQQGYESEQF